MKNVIDAEHVGNARGRNEQLNLIVRSNTSTLNFAEREDAKLLGGLRYARASSMRGRRSRTYSSARIPHTGHYAQASTVAGSARNALGRELYTGKLVSADKAYRMAKQLRALHRLEDEMRVQQTPEYLRLVFQINTVDELMRSIQNELRSEPIPQNDACVDQLVDVHEAIQTEMENLINFPFIVQRYVDIYSARLENLLEYSFNHAFMLHEHCQAEFV
ncbi:unnamed protein product [Peronospora farinosa]|uniref:Uncharacterized protein n=1 Tax=Peronospora farinosa TaxID=134698 RepID=A0AAV0SW21_9STRA|nr:unnamed protein product [Peronospora farinosa]